MTVIVQLNLKERRAVRIIDDPGDVYRCMRQGVSLVAVNECDIDRQMIDGMTVEAIFTANDLIRQA